MTPASISIRVAAAVLHGIGVTLPRRFADAAELLRIQHNVLVLAADEIDAQSTLTPTEIEADRNAEEARSLRLDARREGVTRCLSPDDQAVIRQALRDINAGVPAACAVQVRALTGTIEGILGRQVEIDGQTVTLPPEQVIITEHPQPRVDGGTLRHIADPEPPPIHIRDSSEVVIDTDAIHRKLDEVRSKLGVEDTEAFRKLLPPRS